MRAFRYALDPLCLLACLAYAINRWVFVPGGVLLFPGTFNDFWLIPAALPIILWLQRRLGLRSHDHAPSWGEIAAHWLVWSVVGEVLCPLIFAKSVGDWRDVVAYGMGAVLAGWWWRAVGLRRSSRPAAN